MGKRSNFERKPRDFDPTTFEAVEPLIKHLPKREKLKGFLTLKMNHLSRCSGVGKLQKTK